MNEKREGLLAYAYRIAHSNPRPAYGTEPDRFGIHLPPWPWHMDCSGAGHTLNAHVDVVTGLDTKDMWADIGRKRAVRVDPRACQPADQLLHRAHDGAYKAGPTEHTETFVCTDGPNRILSVGSSGSKHGFDYVSRPNAFWQDGLRYFAMDSGVPSAPPVIKELIDMDYIGKRGNSGTDVVYVSGTKKLWMINAKIVQHAFATTPKGVLANVGNVVQPVSEDWFDTMQWEPGSLIPPSARPKDGNPYAQMPDVGQNDSQTALIQRIATQLGVH